MPPIRFKKAQNLVEQEGRLLLAIQAIENGKYSSIRAAAEAFAVPRSTLQDRIKGHESRVVRRHHRHKFSEPEEKSMEEWLLSMDSRGFALTHAMCRDMANLLLRAREATPSETTPKVGKNWVTDFIKRHDSLASHLSRRYNYERALSEDPKLIKGWFDLVQNTIQKYGIIPADIWNFDETGFAMGVTSSQYIICSAEYHGKRKVLQAGSREWVTVVEAINAEGGILPPYLILKGKVFLERWFPLPPNWAINLSPNGWTSDQTGLDWLQKHFIPNSTRKGTYILLILDGHSSHLTPQFDKLCEENKIICLCMPAHASHLLQPLDVGCFSVLKKAYGGLIGEEMRNGVNSIDKDDFLQIYPIARKATFKASTIQNSFRGAGLVPLDANHVLEKLNICVESVGSLLLDHSLRPTSSSSASDLDTLWSLSKVQKTSSTIKKDLEPSSGPLTSPLKRRIHRSHDMYVRTAVRLTIVEDRLTKLEASNKTVVKKRAASKKQVSYMGSLRSLEEIQQSVVMEDEGAIGYISVVDAAVEAAVEPTLPPMPLIRRVVTCSGCGVQGHRYP